ncbi:MAG: HAMP domain-containing histidine kinase [Elusimicrobia bacterium]|nr:HAMP domain-containing histidine kinase [Elusimicrobiota bacterium]
MKIGTKLITVSSAAVVVVLGVGGSVILSRHERTLADMMRLEAVRHGQTIKNSLRHPMLANKPDDAQWIVETIGQGRDISGVRVFNKGGVVKFSSSKADLGTRADQGSEGCARCHKPGTSPPSSLAPEEAAALVKGPGGGRMIAFMDSIENEPACHACHPARAKSLGTLQVLFSFDRVASQIAAQRRTLLLSMLLLLAVIAAAQAFFTYRQVSVPVGKLIDAAGRVAAGDMSVDLPALHDDELGQLARDFSFMAGKLREARDRDKRWTDALATKVSHATARLEAANRKLLAADAARSRFVREVSHQLRSQLASVKNCLAVVREGHASTQEKKDEMIARAEKKARLLGDLVRDLLDLAHIEEGLAGKHREPTRLDTVAKKSIESLRWKADDKGLTLSFAAESGLPAVEADPRELSIVVDNLIDNAIKYSHQGGAVSVDLITENEWLILSVQDDGIGVLPEEAGAVFQEFYRTESAVHHEKEGTGLGLCIVKRLVESNGGKVEMRSEPGEGSIFSVRLPAKDPRA